MPRLGLSWLGGLGLAALACKATVAAAPPAEVPGLRLPTARWIASFADKGGVSELLLAVAKRDVAAAAHILREGGNPNEMGPMLQGGLRTSPLGMAAARGDVATVDLLLEAGALPNGPAGTRPPIWNAALSCSVDVTRTLVRRGASVEIRRGAGGVTPLLAACQGGCPSVACVMIERGADPHAATVDGVTPLMAAAWWGSAAVLRELLDADPDLLATDHAGHDGVYFAALRGHTECLRLLLDAGSKSDRATVHGWTALMAAARSGCTSCITLLLDHKADPNATAANGWSPMQEAARHCHADVMKQLLAVGTSVGITKAHWTALDEAVRGGCPDAMRVLLESEAGLHAGRHHVDTAARQINARVKAAIASPAVQSRLTKCQQVLDEAKKRAEEAF